MTEQQDATPATTDAGHGTNNTTGNATRNQPNNNDRRRGNQPNQPRSGRFKGKCKDLEGVIYDTGLPNSQQDLFTRTTQEIAEYAAREYKGAADIRTTIINQQLPTFHKPSPILMLQDASGKDTTTPDPADVER